VRSSRSKRVLCVFAGCVVVWGAVLMCMVLRSAVRCGVAVAPGGGV
jgi:hypothetical protein